jgi:hypothetical protein
MGATPRAAGASSCNYPDNRKGVVLPRELDHML